MSQTPRSLDELLERFLAWVEPRPDIRAVVVIGSQARAERPPDAWSDLDLLVVSLDPQFYLS